MQAGAYQLEQRIRMNHERPPVGVEPWKSREILGLLRRFRASGEDKRAYSLAFLDGVLDLVGEDEVRTFRRFWEQSLMTESRVLADDPTCRDHVAHVTQVFLVGWIILNGVSLFARPPDEWNPYGWKGSKKQIFEKLNRCWLYASLLHDCGYAVEKASKAASHEVGVRALFGEMYEPSTPGRVDPKTTVQQAEPLWKKREVFNDRWPRVPRDIEKIIKDQAERGDHGLLGGVALWREAERVRKSKEKDAPGRADIIEAAAVATACHNFFKHVTEPEKSPDEEPNRWLRLDLRREPIGALLACCDEIQEWGRERGDQEYLTRIGAWDPQFERTDLLRFDLSEGAGLSIDVELLRALRPEDKPRMRRIRRKRERDIAKLRRQFVCFLGQEGTEDPFRLRLRVQETIDSLKCSNTWGVGLDSAGDSDLGANEPTEVDLGPEPRDGWRPMWVPLSEGKEEIRFDGNSARLPKSVGTGNEGLRLVVLAPGGWGKSTLLRALAKTAKIGRKTVTTRYIESLGESLVDLRAWVEDLHRKNEGKPVLLLVDHLDRLVEEETGEYWLQQLKWLPKKSWLHVVAASRQEEYDRYMKDVIEKSFKHEELDGDLKAALTEGGEEEDGRTSPREILKRITNCSSNQFRELCAIARSFGLDRSRMVDVEHLAIEDGPGFRQAKVLEADGRRGYRFVHDAVQDALSAAWLAQELADAERSQQAEGKQEADKRCRAVVRTMQALPRDVPRMLFSLVSGDAFRRFDRRTLAAAGRGLARGLLRAPTVQQWLNDTGRQDQAFEPLKRYRASASDDESRALAEMMTGHTHYIRMRMSSLNDRRKGRKEIEDNGRPAIIHLAKAASICERLIEQADDEARRTYAVNLAFSAEHAFMLLSRILNKPEHQDEGRRIADQVLSELDHRRKPEPMHPGWFAGLIEDLSRTTKSEEMAKIYERMDENLGTMNDELSGGDKSKPGPLDVRRSYVAGHIGHRYMEHVFAREPDKGLLDKACHWYWRSIARREKILRYMEESEDIHDQELYGTLAQGYTDVALQYNRMFEAKFYQTHLVDSSGDRLQELLDLHRIQTNLWQRVDNLRHEGERRSVQFWTCEQCLVIGGVLARCFSNRKIPDNEELAKMIEKVRAEIQIEVGVETEKHPRKTDEKVNGDPLANCRYANWVFESPEAAIEYLASSKRC